MQTYDKSHNSELLARVKQGDNQALDELVRLNLGLVKSLALRFRDRSLCGGRAVEYEDLVQIGTIGMIKAARSYDPSYGTAFSTYAVPLIIGEIRRFLRDDGLLKVGRMTKKIGADIARRREEFIAEHGREPHVSELAELCGLPEAEIVYAMEAVGTVRSLSEVTGDDDSLTLESTLAEESGEIEFATDKIALHQAIEELPELWQKIIHLRFERELSQQQTGRILGLSQVKISREEKKILNRLRSAL
ncbi:MAG: sigma-70 family RNA polymerase sigma factor [Eubacteriales bacterium]|jgi:RNA polymerase sporulation-specific sigma factor|nr:sigma-70 family RNA polymerase sigma factor [Clostridiales bacterium]